ncbi:MAG TPA: hypothetical protein VHT05_08815 [Candidatus Elarobacter sp.]|nr:hypothetical protein [Candidatus Elarobacter sp.]
MTPLPRSARRALAAGALLLATACSTVRADGSPRTFHGVPLAPNVHCADADCSGYSVDPAVRTRSRYGIGCMGNVPPGTTPNPEPPPQSYSANDVGKPGFPALSADDAATLRRIRRYVHSRTLRIAWLGPSQPNREFIVFDAPDGGCRVEAAGYGVLNGGCNEFYQPGENPYGTHAGSGCYPMSRPWMTPEPGRHAASRR